MPTERTATLPPNGSPEPWPDIRAHLPSGHKYAGGDLVQWDEPISPPEGAGILARMAASFPEVTAYQRAYDRYTRYSFAFDEKNFKLDFTDGVLTYKSIKGSSAAAGAGGGGGGVAQGSGGQPGGWMQRYPNVTIFEGSTEAPDETAHGDWLKLVATAGLQWDKATFEYLVQGNHKVDRRADPFFGGAVSLSMNRTRPARPPEAPRPETPAR